MKQYLIVPIVVLITAISFANKPLHTAGDICETLDNARWYSPEINYQMDMWFGYGGDDPRHVTHHVYCKGVEIETYWDDQFGRYMMEYPLDPEKYCEVSGNVSDKSLNPVAHTIMDETPVFPINCNNGQLESRFGMPLLFELAFDGGINNTHLYVDHLNLVATLMWPLPPPALRIEVTKLNGGTFERISD